MLTAVYFLFVFQKQPKTVKETVNASQIKQITDLDVGKRPFVTLTPTSPGSEIIISIENMSEFDNIEYELTYLSDNPQLPGEKLQRGSTGTDVNTKEPKYKKSMLLGTASKGVSSPDKNISDGKLTMHMFKGDVEYQSETKWDMFQVGSKATEIKDSTGKFSLSIPALGKDYFIILADTLGVPKSGDIDLKKVLLPVYGTFSIAPNFSKKAQLTINLDNPPAAVDLLAYDHQEGKVTKLDSQLSGAKLSAQIDSLATFVVVSSK
jgi:hypothetical protein